MTTNSIFKFSFLIGIATIVTGAYLKILHKGNADIFLTAGIVFWIIFIIIGLYEVHSSKRIDRQEKVFWTIGFVVMGALTGLLYLLIGRKRIANLQ